MTQPLVYVVDDDAAVRDSLSVLLESAGYSAAAFADAGEFLAAHRTGQPGCVVLDVHMFGMSGLELQHELAVRRVLLPIIFLTAYGDIPTTVRAIKAGAVDFLTKPVDGRLLLERVKAALAASEEAHKRQVRLASLSQREWEILHLAVAGQSNKSIGRALGISHRTVEVHRSRILSKTGATTLLELAYLVAAAQGASPDQLGLRL